MLPSQLLRAGVLTALVGVGLATQFPGFTATTTSLEDAPPLLLDATLEQLRAGLDAGKFTSADLVNTYVDRILEVNSTLRMVAELNPDALDVAVDADERRASGQAMKSSLDGIPILLKDNIATGDHMGNTAGSYALVGAKVPGDSTVAAKLRDAGAVLLGKASLSEWANYRSTNSSSGWSARVGQTEGAYYPRQDPSGSSSGPGVASSLGLALASLGTETDGSIVSPSDYNNLVGIKPTVGLTSRYLVVPVSEFQDTVGPMARTVKDAAHVLGVIAGKDPNDNYTSAIPFEQTPNYTAACELSALEGKRVGIPRHMFDITGSEKQYGAIISAFNASLDVFRQAGATVVDDIHLEGYDEISGGSSYEDVVLKASFVSNVAEYLSGISFNPANLTSLADLLAFTQGNPLEEYPSRNAETWKQALALGLAKDSPEVWSNYTASQYYGGLLGVTGALRNHSLDALLVPSRFSTPLPAAIGSPIVTVPLGSFPKGQEVVRNSRGNLVDIAPNLPFGVAFLGEHFSEERLIGMAYAFEQRTMVRGKVKPYVQPKTEISDTVARTMAMVI